MSHCRVESTVNDKLCSWQEVYPIILSFANKEAQVGFNFLILTLYLAIGLRMIGSCKTCIYPKSFVQGSHASCCKLGSSVTDNFLRDPMQGKNMVEVNRGNSIHSDL